VPETAGVFDRFSRELSSRVRFSDQPQVPSQSDPRAVVVIEAEVRGARLPCVPFQQQGVIQKRTGALVVSN
jgi:hypothetical protein